MAVSPSVLLFLLVLIPDLAHSFVAPRPTTAAVHPNLGCLRQLPSTYGLQMSIYHSSRLCMVSEEGDSKSPSSSLSSESIDSKSSNLPFWLDPNTKGGVVVLALAAFIIPVVIYNIFTGILGYDSIETGKWIGIGFTIITSFLWLGTYLFRVATKDMTYVREPCLRAVVCGIQ